MIKSDPLCLPVCKSTFPEQDVVYIHPEESVKICDDDLCCLKSIGTLILPIKTDSGVPKGSIGLNFLQRRSLDLPLGQEVKLSLIDEKIGHVLLLEGLPRIAEVWITITALRRQFETSPNVMLNAVTRRCTTHDDHLCFLKPGKRTVRAASYRGLR